MKVRIISACMVLAIMFSALISGCETIKEKPLIPGENAIVETTPISTYSERYNNFAAKLFSECYSDKNTLVSPLSVMFALALTSEGADGETLKQMENALGLNKDELKSFVYSYMYPLQHGDETGLTVANSLWMNSKKDFEPIEEFMDVSKGFYFADVERIPFNKSAEDKINSWVKENTKGQIEKAVNNLDEDMVMLLINALGFDCKWQKVYSENSVEKANFTTESGKIVSADFMHSQENVYLEDALAKGFIKYYEGEKYAFAAMLPDEGVSVADYVKQLSGDKITELLKNQNETMVHTAIPKFKTEYTEKLVDILSGMGMKDCFDPYKADFSRMGSVKDGNLYVGDVVHSASITVGELGTKAGAVTAVYVYGTSAPADPKEVILNRPFVYMLVDVENSIPLFIGTVNNI